MTEQAEDMPGEDTDDTGEAEEQSPLERYRELYNLNNDINYITAGLGYRAGGFYADLAYVHRQMTSTYHCFTPFTDYDGYWSQAPSAKITDNSNQLVLTLGYKF